MNRILRPQIVLNLAAVVLISAAVAGAVLARPADAHGSTQVPASRAYTCRFENPNNAMCSAAWSSNSQALYDWMEVNIGDAAGRHQELIPDGQLCSAGREKYAAFDRPGEWPVTALHPNRSGLVELSYQNTAPHSTEYYRVYITRNGFDARTDALAWADLELAYDSGPLDRAPQQQMQAALPSRDLPAILYIVWQRSDSPEAFYACSDVTITGGSVSPPAPGTSTPSTPTLPTTAVPPTTTTEVPGVTTPDVPPSEPTTTPATDVPTPPVPPSDPSTTMPGVPEDDPDIALPPGDDVVSVVTGIEAEKQVTASWDSGQCFVVKVTNTTSSARDWEVHLSPGGRVDALWNASSTAMGDGDEPHLRLVGEDWNSRLSANRWTSFGMCVGS